MQRIDVEQIMQEIRAEIAENNYSDEEINFMKILANMDNANLENCFQARVLENKFDYISAHYNNPVYFKLPGNKIKVFIQKVIRRIFLFVIFPAFQYQNAFNEGVVSSVRQIKNYIGETSEVKRLPKKVAVLEKKLDEQDELIKQLQQTIEELKRGQD